MEVTIKSNYVDFFTDVNIDSHKRALERLWEKLRQKYQSNLVRTVHVMIIMTDAQDDIVGSYLKI